MKKNSLIKSVASLLLYLLLIYAPSAGCCVNVGDLCKAKYEKTENLSAPFATGQTLYLQNNVGKIIVTGADIAECNVTAVITAKAATTEKAQKLAEQVRIKLESSAGKLSITVEKHKSSITIDFNIIVPMKTALQLTSNIGEIQISNITGSIKAETNIGAVSCEEITGDIDIYANIGQVKVLYSGTAPGACNANIKTNIGEINFAASEDLSAQVNLSTNIGSIETDLPLTVKGKIGKNLNGTIGKGEGKVTLKTNIGAIKIK